MYLEENESDQAECNKSFKEERCVSKLIHEKISISKMLPSKSEDLINLAVRQKGQIFTKGTLHFLNATYFQKCS